jgi:hypothetical protein
MINERLATNRPVRSAGQTVLVDGFSDQSEGNSLAFSVSRGIMKVDTEPVWTHIRLL